jgi:hypothetical protein
VSSAASQSQTVLTISQLQAQRRGVRRHWCAQGRPARPQTPRSSSHGRLALQRPPPSTRP